MELKNVMPNLNKITFCINTSRNEKAYIELLLQSLLNGIDVQLHDIIIFVDSDNQETTKTLIEQKSLFPNLKIVKNNGDPVGYATNSNWMFDNAKTEIISYLQSDNVICLDYDKKILSQLTDNMILSSTRCEPPLHAKFSNNVTYVENFGLTPEEFNYEEFLKFAEINKNESKLTNHFFAPFSMYKKVWNEIGGYDVKFKKSREDSDIALRLCLNKIQLVQTWNPIVYHFSCISSRMPGWWLPENQHKDIIRQQNDRLELERFVQKWGTFIHPSSYSDIPIELLNNPNTNNNIIVKNPPIDNKNFLYL